MKKILLICSLLTTTYTYANLGHRAGGDYYRNMPENSLIVLQESLTGKETGYAVQNSDQFLYLEFDVYETKDNIPVVFHDKRIKGLIPYNANNKAAYAVIKKNRKVPKYKKLRIKDLTLAELKSFRLWGEFDQQVPTVQEFLDTSRDFGLKKPMIVELKYLYTDIARTALLNMVEEYKDNYANHAAIILESNYDFGADVKVAFLGFRKNFKKSLGRSAQRKKWCKKIIQAGLHGVFRPRKHAINYCD